MATRPFEVVEDAPEPQATPPSRIDIDQVTVMLRLQAQRFAIALSDLFSLITVCTVFALALMIIPRDPTAFQLSGLAGYALFVIAINIIVRRRK